MEARRHWESKRNWMVENQIVSRGVADASVLEAMRTVPRERFVPENLAEFAYDDTPLPIEESQTISQPYIVAVMTEALELRPGDRVLEIGAGSGYAAAVLGQIAAEVFTIERHRGLAEHARDRMTALGYDNVTVVAGDGTLGWGEHRGCGRARSPPAAPRSAGRGGPARHTGRR